MVVRVVPMRDAVIIQYVKGRWMVSIEMLNDENNHILQCKAQEILSKLMHDESTTLKPEE